MVKVGGMFRGQDVESVVVKAIYDDEGVRTGTKRTIKVLSDMNKEVKKQRTYVKENKEKWKEHGYELKRNEEYYKKLAARAKNYADMKKRIEKSMKQAKFDAIAGMNRINTVRDSKGRLTEGTQWTTFAKGLDEFQKKIVSSNTTTRNLNNGMMELTTTFTNFEGKVVKTTKSIKRQQSQFQMWALSFMFAGMQIKRTAEMITRASVGTFIKITQGQTEAGRSIIGLAANFKFLQFSIGQAIGTALKPLMPILTSMIRGIAQFVQLHPEATFAAIAGAFILGTGLFLGGQMVLFANGVTTMVNNAGGLAGVAQSFKTIGKNVGKTVGLGVGFYYAYETLKDIDKDSIIKTTSEALLSVAGFTAATGNFKMAGGLAAIGIGLNWLEEGINAEDFYKTLSGAMTSIGGGIAMAGFGATGAALITVGVAMQLVGGDAFVSFATSIITFLVHNIVRLATGVIATLLSSFDSAVNNAVGAYNFFARKTPFLSEITFESNVAGGIVSSMEEAIKQKERDLINMGNLPEWFDSSMGLSSTISRLSGDTNTEDNLPAPMFSSGEQQKQTIINANTVNLMTEVTPQGDFKYGINRFT